MPLSKPITPGTVDWTGENPGILLKNEDGSFTAMALFFRVAWSPVGQGQVLLLYGTPGKADADAGAPNILLSDNAELSQYLLDNFIGKLGAFRDSPAFDNLTHVVAQSIYSSGDPMGHRYTETVAGEGYSVELVWEDLESPCALELTPDQVGTGEHTMFTLLVPAQKAQIIVNGKSLPGAVGTRVQAGMETTSAFLYFSETWVIPPAESA